MHGSRRQRFVMTAAVSVSAVAAVTVALIVVALTRPSDHEIREEVAVHLGVSREVLNIPVVRRVLAQTSSEARAIVFDELDQSLLLGGVAGLLAAVGASMLITQPWRASTGEPAGEPKRDPTLE